MTCNCLLYIKVILITKKKRLKTEKQFIVYRNEKTIVLVVGLRQRLVRTEKDKNGSRIMREGRILRGLVEMLPTNDYIFGEGEGGYLCLLTKRGHMGNGSVNHRIQPHPHGGAFFSPFARVMSPCQCRIFASKFLRTKHHTLRLYLIHTKCLLHASILGHSFHIIE